MGAEANLGRCRSNFPVDHPHAHCTPDAEPEKVAGARAPDHDPWLSNGGSWESDLALSHPSLPRLAAVESGYASCSLTLQAQAL